MTISHINIILFIMFTLWSAWNFARIFERESQLLLISIKVNRIENLKAWNLFIPVVALFMWLFLPISWLVPLVVTACAAAINCIINWKSGRLVRQIETINQQTSILALEFGRIYDSTEGKPLRIWAKRSQESWPVVEFELGVGHMNLPIDEIRNPEIAAIIIPRIMEGLEQDHMAELLPKIKGLLVKAGVSHPIDIKGWDCHPAVREMIERIMDAECLHQDESESSVPEAA